MWSQAFGSAFRQAAAGLLIYPFLRSIVSAQCVPYPVAATIGHVSLSNGQTARGAALSVGTPPQSFAFAPQWLAIYRSLEALRVSRLTLYI